MTTLVRHGSGLLMNDSGGLAQSLATPGSGSNQPYRSCCGGKCGCMCNALPSSWTVEFHGCTHELTCLNGMTIVINRGDPLIPAGPFDGDGTCNGYANGSYICEGGTGHVKWIGVNMNDHGFGVGLGSGYVYSVSVGIDSDQTFFGIPIHVYNGSYSVAGYLDGDPARADFIDGDYARWDCVNQSGTISQTGSLMYFAFDFLHWGLQCDVTPNA